MFTGAQFFSQFTPFFSNKTDSAAEFIAFFQNLLISVSFIVMFWLRQDVRGQSFLIAVLKWIGTPLTIGFLYVTRTGWDVGIINLLVASIFVFDSYYMYLIYNELKIKNINPWTRI
jgi:hypothetical protein